MKPQIPVNEAQLFAKLFGIKLPVIEQLKAVPKDLFYYNFKKYVLFEEPEEQDMLFVHEGYLAKIIEKEET